MHGTPLSQYARTTASERARSDVHSLYATEDALPLEPETPALRPSLRTWLATMRRRAGLARA